MQDLLEHQAWVKALALRLVRDPHLAEDLAQETYVALLERPTGSVLALRAWLGTVLRNLVRERVRSDGSRRWREESTARQEATESTVEMYAKVSAHQQVVDTVMELPEHYREVLLLRYFEGLTPTAIAERVNLPISTVKTRLARGLAGMRERLDRAAGGDGEAWMQALAPLTGGAALGVSTSALVTALVLRISAAVLVVAGGGWLLWSEFSASDDIEQDSEVVALEFSGELSAPAGPASEEATELDGEREALPTEEASASAVRAPEAPTDYPLVGRVVDVGGRAVPGVVLSFRGRSYGDREGEIRITVSANDGSFEFEAARGAGRVTALGEGFVTLFAGEVQGDYSSTDLRVVVAPGGELSGRVVDEEGAAIEGAEVAVLPPSGFGGARSMELQGSSLALCFVETDSRGHFDLGVAIDVEGARLQVLAEGFEAHEVPRPVGSQEELYVEMQRPKFGADALRGRVESVRGVPLANARVSYAGTTTRTKESGEFQFERQDEGARGRATQVHAYHPNFGPASLRLDDDESARGELVLKLPAEALTITGRVLDEAGDPVKGLTVFLSDPTLFKYSGESEGGLRRTGPMRRDLISRELRYELLEDLASGHFTEETETEEAEAAKWLAWSKTSTDAEGRFELGGLVARDYELVLFLRGALDRRVVGPIAAGSEDVELSFTGDAGRRRVAGRLVDTQGHPVAGARVVSVCSAFPISFEGEVLVTSTTNGASFESDSNGQFDLGRIALDAVHLEVYGDDVVRRSIGGPDDPLADYVADELANLEIVVSRRLRVRVELLESSEANRIAMVDAEGEAVPFVFETPGRLRTLETAKLLDGRSDDLIVPDRAVELILLLDEEEVRRVPFEFSAERVTVIRP